MQVQLKKDVIIGIDREIKILKFTKYQRVIALKFSHYCSLMNLYFIVY